MNDINSTITILTCNQKGKRATKRFVMHEDGSIKKIDFNAGTFFTHEERLVSNLEELVVLLDELSNEPRKFIIRGKIKEGMGDVVHRKCHEPDAAFDSMPQRYVMLDIDKLVCPEFFDVVNKPQEIIAWVQEILPEPFRERSCYYQFSSSQNVPFKPEQYNDKVSIHLYFWCDRSVGDEEWKRYFKSISSPVDCTLFSPVQPHYTAKPIFEKMLDPLPNRSGIFKGKYDFVTVPEIPEPSIIKYANRSEKEPVINIENCKKALELLFPYYKEGSRNRFSGAIAATLYRGGWNAENAADFIYQLAEMALDEEINERYKNALRACDSIDHNRPVPGIPALKEVGINNIDEILSLLGIGDYEINKAISKLIVSSNDYEVKEVIKTFIHLSRKEQKRYIASIAKVTNKTENYIEKLIEETQFENSFVSRRDMPDRATQYFLSSKYANGAHLLKASDGRYYRYNLKYWEYITDDLVKKGLLPYVRQILAEEGAVGVSYVLNGCLNILAGQVPRENDPFRLTNQEIPSIINCQNGELCFDKIGNVTLKPHRPESYLRNCLEVKYDPDAISPMFDEAVIEIFSKSSDPQDMFRHFMELVGYICQPSRKIAIIVLLYGGGSNGKTSLLKIILRILGDTIMSGRLGDIENSDFKIGALDGKLMVLDDDVDGGACIPDGFLKKISEEKTMTGQHKYKPPFEFVCRAVPVMLANDYPVTRDLTYGLRRRIMVIPFNRRFKPHEIKDDLFDMIWEVEASGILNHIMQGFRRLKRRGKFEEPADCTEAKNKWLVRSNILTTFIEEECEFGEGFRVHLGVFYEAFKHYCINSGVRNIPSLRTVTSRLEGLDYRISLLNGKNAVWGIRLSYAGFGTHSDRAKPDLR